MASDTNSTKRARPANSRKTEIGGAVKTSLTPSQFVNRAARRETMRTLAYNVPAGVTPSLADAVKAQADAWLTLECSFDGQGVDYTLPDGIDDAEIEALLAVVACPAVTAADQRYKGAYLRQYNDGGDVFLTPGAAVALFDAMTVVTDDHHYAVPDLEDVWSDVGEMNNAIHLLMADLEFTFDRSRGRRDGCGGIDLSFHLSSIEATEWLAGQLFTRIGDLKEKLDRAVAAKDADDAPLPQSNPAPKPGPVIGSPTLPQRPLSELSRSTILPDLNLGGLTAPDLIEIGHDMLAISDLIDERTNSDAPYTVASKSLPGTVENLAGLGDVLDAVASWFRTQYHRAFEHLQITKGSERMWEDERGFELIAYAARTGVSFADIRTLVDRLEADYNAAP